MAKIRTEEEKEAARQAAKQAKKDQWLREQEEKRPTHEKYMKDAIRQAKKAAALGEVPIGCVIVHDGQVIGRGYNRRNTDKSTLAHAEITAIKRASKKLHIVCDAGALPDVCRSHRAGADSGGYDRLHESKGRLRRINL